MRKRRPGNMMRFPVLLVASVQSWRGNMLTGLATTLIVTAWSDWVSKAAAVVIFLNDPVKKTKKVCDHTRESRGPSRAIHHECSSDIVQHAELRFTNIFRHVTPIVINRIVPRVCSMWNMSYIDVMKTEATNMIWSWTLNKYSHGIYTFLYWHYLILPNNTMIWYSSSQIILWYDTRYGPGRSAKVDTMGHFDISHNLYLE